MEVVCENCKARLNIPDEKIPKGKRTIISCPKCKNKVTLEPPGPEPEMPVPEVPKEPEPPRPKARPASGAEDVEDLGFFEEGVKLALVLENDPQEVEAIKAAVEELGYKYVSAENTRKAVSALRLHHFDLVILSDRFEGVEMAQSPVLQYMNHLSMSVRRRIFFALIGDAFKTMDNMTAFAMSVNMVMSREDLAKLPSILKRGISENEHFYKVLTDLLVEVGKA
ncbi:MAG: zinc-ribbon domain-containing protein [Deltaproteobacteria bacterium]|nr:zinc-ribbon domain-containing protein [Deltaproteobacteria bacterium]MBW2116428.1 zinc-ribbon domain-containing protein [Deltaproteobacteria bacterium]MBW2344564.1 zinc-ribbon domain-containing protein [Deltaproteobacteria bacterium]